jgi:hypothetical protein
MLGISMIGLAIRLVLVVVAYFAITLEITKAYGQSEVGTIHLQSIQDPEEIA